MTFNVSDLKFVYDEKSDFLPGPVSFLPHNIPEDFPRYKRVYNVSSYESYNGTIANESTFVVSPPYNWTFITGAWNEYMLSSCTRIQRATTNGIECIFVHQVSCWIFSDRLKLIC